MSRRGDLAAGCGVHDCDPVRHLRWRTSRKAKRGLIRSESDTVRASLTQDWALRRTDLSEGVRLGAVVGAFGVPVVVVVLGGAVVQGLH